MARIRTIKPEFFTSDDIVGVSPLARLFYVSLWCEADREGRLAWSSSALKRRYLPNDDCDIDDIAEELISRGMIVLYEINGKQYCEVPTFSQHQIINNRESPSVLPARVKDASTRGFGEGRKEGKGREDASKVDDDPAPPAFNPKAELKERGVTDQTAKDWLTLRKAKKAPVSLTALQNIISQADKAGLSLERALCISCRRGWTGFEAAWLKPGDTDAAKPAKDWT